MPKTINPRNGLAAIRKSRGFTSQFVAKSIGANPSTMSGWEKAGARMSLLAEHALAQFYGMPISEIKEAVARVEA